MFRRTSIADTIPPRTQPVVMVVDSCVATRRLPVNGNI
jgi:hypothetical protein